MILLIDPYYNFFMLNKVVFKGVIPFFREIEDGFGSQSMGVILLVYLVSKICISNNKLELDI